MIYNLPSLIYYQQDVHSFYIKFALNHPNSAYIQVGRNICHGSDAVESANKEIALWFKPEELCSYDSCQKDWIYE